MFANCWRLFIYFCRFSSVLGERSPACHVQQFHQLRFGHRPALSATVDLGIGFRHFGERVRGEAMRLDAPITKADQLLPVLIAIPRRHAVGLLTIEPSCQPFRRTFRQTTKATFFGKASQSRLRVGDASGVQPFDNSVFVKSCEVLGERNSLMIGGRVFGRRDDFAADEFSPAFQLAENRPSGIFLTATGRDCADMPLAVAKLGRVGCSFDLDSQRTILTGRHLGRSRLSLGWFPFRKLLPGPCEQ
ncbi:MAG: hypothetical protein NT013_24655 [Planctomycetia bacterium]|nr:hypothetical protein [Planctomycetia bacterium]